MSFITSSILILMIVVCSFLCTVGNAIEADFYVATDGDDAWSGKLQAPNDAGTDGPFATIGRAQDAVREIRGGITDRPIKVLIRGGIYRLHEPIRFTPEDSGFEDAATVYAAYPGEKPIFSGGRRITGWEKGDGELWTAKVDDVADGDWYFHQLFVNGERRTRARHPNEGYLHIADTLKPLKDRREARGDRSYKVGFEYGDDDIKRWDNFDDVNLILYHSWTASLHWIKELDEENNIVRFTNRCGWPVAYWDAKQRYHVENFLEALDTPGEWYLQRESGTLYYWPVEGEKMTEAEVIAPRLQHLVEFQGDAHIGLPVSHLTLQGLSFQHAAWRHDRDDVADGQAATHLTAAVVASGARNCNIERCEIAHVGEYGVIVGEGCKHNRLFQCHIHDLGAGGVRLGMTSLPDEKERRADHNTVDNCFIHDGGHVFRAGVGVWIGKSSYNTVSHNDICDFRYSGCSVGWSWGYAPSTAHHNIFEYNHIHNLGKRVLSDMGGIYSLGKSPGTVERFNLIHDVYSYSYGGWGLYTDEGSSQILMENNICYNCKTGCFHQHYGRENILRNNIFAFSETAPVIRSREEDHISFRLKHNIVVTNNGLVLGKNWSNDNFETDHNLYWGTSERDLDFAGHSFGSWQERGHDEHSIIADPLFVDIENYDFRLQEGSPAFDIGFEAFDTTDIGLYGEDEWVQRPENIERAKECELEIPPEPEPVADDFEDTPAGRNAENARTMGEYGGASIRVSEEASADGDRSLKFTDAAGLEHEWQPHIVYRPIYNTGTVHLSFDARLEPGAKLWHEWRDRANPYRVGPSLHISAGELTVGDRTLMNVPSSEWINCRITCPLGDEAGEWSLQVTDAEGNTRTFDGLSIVDDDWRAFRWLGFISMATEKAVFYIDNLQLQREENE